MKLVRINCTYEWPEPDASERTHHVNLSFVMRLSAYEVPSRRHQAMQLYCFIVRIAWPWIHNELCMWRTLCFRLTITVNTINRWASARNFQFASLWECVVSSFWTRHANSRQQTACTITFVHAHRIFISAVSTCSLWTKVNLISIRSEWLALAAWLTGRLMCSN